MNMMNGSRIASEKNDLLYKYLTFQRKIIKQDCLLAQTSSLMESKSILKLLPFNKTLGD